MNHESGSMLMETVIVMPLLLALIFGVLQLAHIYTARQISGYAAYCAARAALSAVEGAEEEAAEKATRHVLCWLAASPDGMHDGLLMPDPDAGPIRKRLLEFSVKKVGWSREVEFKFAFPLVFPLAAQIIGYHFDPVTLKKGKSGTNISTEKFGDQFSGPHLILHERVRIAKPYMAKK